MDQIADQAPVLPGWALLPVAALFSLVILIAVSRLRNRWAGYLLLAVSMRYLMSAFHEVTFRASPLGISWNALASTLIVLVGVFVISPRRLALRLLVPFYLLIAVIVLSGAVNGAYAGLVTVATKNGYLIIIALCTLEALRTIGPARVTAALLLCFVLPLVLQVLSLALNVAKIAEADGAASYIGGYDHEASFSVVLMTAFFVATLVKMPRARKGLLLLVPLVGLYFANYRTALLAVAPMAFVQFIVRMVAQFRAEDRRLAVFAAVMISGLACVIVASLFQERFHDLALMFSGEFAIIRPPETFTVDDTRVLSGRPFIWSTYLFAYFETDWVRHLIGSGPESWLGRFTHYAHNTLVSALYEYGLLGVAAHAFLWGAMLTAALRVRDEVRSKLVAAHLSFIFLNMATMPHWMIEGNILYGLICGFTFYYALSGGAQSPNGSTGARTATPVAATRRADIKVRMRHARRRRSGA